MHSLCNDGTEVHVVTRDAGILKVGHVEMGTQRVNVDVVAVGRPHIHPSGVGHPCLSGVQVDQIVPVIGGVSFPSGEGRAMALCPVASIEPASWTQICPLSAEMTAS